MLVLSVRCLPPSALLAGRRSSDAGDSGTRPLCSLRPSMVSTPAAATAISRWLSRRLLRVWIQPGGLSTRGPAWAEATVLRGALTTTHSLPQLRLSNPSTKPTHQAGFVRDERLAFNMPGFSPIEPAFASIVPSKGDECHGAVSDCLPVRATLMPDARFIRPNPSQSAKRDVWPPPTPWLTPCDTAGIRAVTG